MIRRVVNVADFHVSHRQMPPRRVERGLQFQDTPQNSDSLLVVTLGRSLPRTLRESRSFGLGCVGLFRMLNDDLLTLDLNHDGSWQISELLQNQRRDDCQFRILNWRSSLEGEEVGNFDANRSHLSIFPNSTPFSQTSPPAPRL